MPLPHPLPDGAALVGLSYGVVLDVTRTDATTVLDQTFELPLGGALVVTWHQGREVARYECRLFVSFFANARLARSIAHRRFRAARRQQFCAEARRYAALDELCRRQRAEMLLSATSVDPALVAALESVSLYA